MRGDSRSLGAAVALMALAMLLAAAVSPATAGPKRPPKVVYAEFAQNPQDESEYRFKAGVLRAKSVAVELRKSPAAGETTGPKETIPLNKVSGSSSPTVWVGDTSKTRPAPCYRAAFVARNQYGRHGKAYRLCIFGHGAGETVRVAPW